MFERKNYLFIDEDSGEYFFVNTTLVEAAIEIAKDWFDHPKYLHEICDDNEAEILGYDTY